MGCTIKRFNIKGEWESRTIMGDHKLEMATATYKPITYRGRIVPSADLGEVTLFKVDGKFKGAVMTTDRGVVRKIAREDIEKLEQAEAEAIVAKWVGKIGLGFHPDTSGDAYLPRFTPKQVHEYNKDMRRLFAIAADPYDVGIKALEALIAKKD